MKKKEFQKYQALLQKTKFRFSNHLNFNIPSQRVPPKLRPRLFREIAVFRQQYNPIFGAKRKGKGEPIRKINLKRILSNQSLIIPGNKRTSKKAVHGQRAKKGLHNPTKHRTRPKHHLHPGQKKLLNRKRPQ